MLHVLEALEGGTARHVVDLVRHAPGRHVVAIPSARVGGVTDALAEQRMVDAGAEVRIVEMRRRPWSPRNVVAAVQLWRTARRVRPDVIHGHSSVGGALARAVGTTVRVPIMWTPNGVMENALVTRVERLLSRVTDCVVAVSASEAETIERLGLARPGRLVTIPNGIELGAPSAPTTGLRDLIGVAPNTCLVGCVARLSRQKAPELLIEAWRRISASRPDAALVWIGDGPDAELLRAASAELPSLTWIPSLPDAQSYLGELDVFVLASRYEGAPYAPLEAMRAGVPVVLSDVVGNRDLIRDGENGSLVSPGDPGDLARALLILIDRADLRARLGQAGRESVKNGRNVVDTAQATASLYRRLAGGGGAPITAPNGFPQNRDVLSEFGHPRANRYDSTDDGIASTLPPRETT